MKWRSCVVLTSVAAFLVAHNYTVVASGAHNLRIIIRAFVPYQDTLGSSSLTLPVPQSTKTMIRGIPAEQGCFLTDQRGFVDTVQAFGQVSSDVTVTTRSTGIAVLPSVGASPHRTGTVTRIDCTTGSVRETRSVRLTRRYTRDALMGEAEGLLRGSANTFTLTAGGTNPFISPGVASPIGYSISFSWDESAQTLSYSGDVGPFPAYEAYVYQGGTAQPVFQVRPLVRTHWRLFDFGTPQMSRKVRGNIRLASENRKPS